jgi:hypothetical protein
MRGRPLLSDDYRYSATGGLGKHYWINVLIAGAAYVYACSLPVDLSFFKKYLLNRIPLSYFFIDGLDPRQHSEICED